MNFALFLSYRFCVKHRNEVVEKFDYTHRFNGEFVEYKKLPIGGIIFEA